MPGDQLLRNWTLLLSVPGHLGSTLNPAALSQESLAHSSSAMTDVGCSRGTPTQKAESSPRAQGVVRGTTQICYKESHKVLLLSKKLKVICLKRRNKLHSEIAVIQCSKIFESHATFTVLLLKYTVFIYW